MDKEAKAKEWYKEFKSKGEEIIFPWDAFKAGIEFGFEAGKQERDREIIEKLREIVDASESNNCSSF